MRGYTILFLAAPTVIVFWIITNACPVQCNSALPIAGGNECSDLTHAYLKDVNLKNLGSWLATCKNLQSLVIDNISMYDIPTILYQVPRLEKLELLRVSNIEDTIVNPFISIERPHNYIKKIKLQVELNPNIQELASNITWDEVSTSLIGQFSLLPELEDLEIIDFVYFDLCSSGPPLIFRKLKRLAIIGSSTSRLCFRHLRVTPVLQELEIKSTVIEELQFSELFSSVTPSLRVKFIGIEDTIFKFTRDDFLSLTDGSRNGNVSLIALLSLQVECNCDSLQWLSRAIDEHFLTIVSTGVKCTDGQDLVNQPCEWERCDRVSCHVSCICCLGVEPGTLQADCQDAQLSALPAELMRLEHLTDLVASNNNISSIPGYLPKKLHALDLSNNKISHLTESAVSALFAEPRRLIWISGNPIECSCDNRELLKALQDHRKQVKDFENITCASDNKKLSKINVTEICLANDLEAKLALERNESKNHETLLAIVITVAVVITVATVILAVAMNYRRQLRIFFFAHGWCFCCIQEEDLDVDRRYDVFVSFCHADQDIVLNELLPKLDDEYSVCIHLRDWMPGEMIPIQIAASVEQSRRTIVFLSKAFLKSLWGILEFRTAYMCSLMEGRIRVVMVVLDDVLESENLPKEVRSYVRYNTYVRWDDPWFWEKLRYALPHCSVTANNASPQMNPEYIIPRAPPHPLLMKGERMTEEQQESINLQEINQEGDVTQVVDDVSCSVYQAT